MTPSQEAYAKTAAHFQTEIALVTRTQVREARRLGVHSIPERQISRGTQGRRLFRKLPLPAIPDGFAVARITTGSDGRQSIVAKPSDPDALGDALPSGHEEAGRSTLLGPDGSVTAQWIKTRAVRPEAITWDRLVRDFDGLIPAADPVERAEGDLLDSILAVYPIGDPHLGLRNRSGYGLQAGANLLYAAAADLVQRGPRARECLIVNLGDYFHSDDPKNRTRGGGHELDVDGDWFGILKVGRDLFVHLIQVALVHHETVHVKILIGNHDDLSSLFLTLLVDAHFRHEDRVIVDTSGAPFQWFEWGANLIGLTHGQKCKTERLAGVMASAQREAWGRTLHRYWYVGHVHHTRRVERDGVVIESFRSLTEPDAWTEAAGYLSGRDLTRIVLHRDHGEVSRETVSAGMLA